MCPFSSRFRFVIQDTHPTPLQMSLIYHFAEKSKQIVLILLTFLFWLLGLPRGISLLYFCFPVVSFCVILIFFFTK
jgi:hypothetical protein